MSKSPLVVPSDTPTLFDELAELKVKRSSIKGQVTKYSNYIAKIDKNETLSELQINELTVRLNKFLDLQSNFDRMQTRIEVINSSNLESELTERDSIEDNIFSCIALTQVLLKSESPRHPDHSSHSCCNHDQSQSYQTASFKLPVIQIHKFDGAFYKWLEFRDTYESLIHNNDRIQPVHKFHYLCSYLEGEAARIISNLEISEDNYDKAWDLLGERYNNKRQLVTNHLNSLFKIEQVRNESDKSLRYLGDQVTKNLRALNSLGQPTEQWDTIIVHMISSKLDQNSFTKWEEYKSGLDDLPSFNDFKQFLKSRADVLESLNRSKRDQSKNNQKSSSNTKSFAVSADNTERSCVVCKGDHRLTDCKVYKALSTDERWKQVTKLKLCHNCLRTGHATNRCRLGGCRVCKRLHNTTLHKHNTDTSKPSEPSSGRVDNKEDIVEEKSTSVAMSAVSSNEVLLSTAIIEIRNVKNNKTERVRALLDSASQSSFITNDLKLRLQLTSQPQNSISILGIGDSKLNIQPQRCFAEIKSNHNTFARNMQFLVLPQITQSLPTQYIKVNHLRIPDHLQMADPHFNVPAQVDVLLGADIFWDLMGTEQQSLGNKLPVLRSSKLGWLIAGPISASRASSVTKGFHCKVANNTDDLESLLKNFWEYEDFPLHIQPKQIITESEKHFNENTTRLESGRFCVRLPLIDSPDCLGDSYFLARKRFFNLERRLDKNPRIKQMYSDFIKEYRDLGHLMDAEVERPPNSYFLPHHAVLKENSESTKLRVVFDASARTSSGYSINDIQMVGPNMQDSLFNILLRFRHYRYVLSGDIEKQYRQITLNETDRNLQLILWREDSSLPLRTLKLKTVTYGFASASYIAARCLWQLGETADPLTKTIVQTDFYCDDLLTGADTESELLQIKQNVASTLQSGCFNLRKYRSNSQEVLDSERGNAEVDNLAISQSFHTLGLGWNPSLDILHYSIDDSTVEVPTKRSILSITFKIFDPLGLLTLCTIKPKMLLQKLWALKLDWDQPVPNSIHINWSQFINNLKYLRALKVPRSVLCDSTSYIEIHAFSDASQVAYGACVYVKSISLQGIKTCNLLCAKSRVAPTKPTTVPRLELNASLLAARLTSTVVSALRKSIVRCVYWSDSSVVLAWLSTCPSKLKTYVANRVATVQELTKDMTWRYVPTKLNPADLASRGVDPQYAIEESRWWHGPSYLLEPEEQWPTLEKNTHTQDLPETKHVTLHTQVQVQSIINFDKYSNFKKLQRIIAYVRRFTNKCKKQPHTEHLSVDELDHALTALVKFAQEQSFPRELEALRQQVKLSPKSNIFALSPFIDSQGILRVGGRLAKSDFDFDKKHPMLLCSKHKLTKLLFTHEHARLLHAGPQLMLASTHEQ